MIGPLPQLVVRPIHTTYCEMGCLPRQSEMERQCQAVLAGMPGAVTHVVGTLAVPVSNLVIAQTVLGPNPVVLAPGEHNGAQQKKEGSLFNTSRQMGVIVAGLRDQVTQFTDCGFVHQETTRLGLR